MQRFDGAAGAALTEAAHRAGVAEEFLQWGMCFDRRQATSIISLGDYGTPLLKVSH